MVNFSKITTDKKLEKEGAWVALDGLFTGIEVKVVRGGSSPEYAHQLNTKVNQKYAEYTVGKLKKDGTRYKPKVAPADIQETIDNLNYMLMAQYIFIDFNGVTETNEAGEEVPLANTTDARIEMLKDNDFRNAIFEIAASPYAYLPEAKAIEADTKN